MPEVNAKVFLDPGGWRRGGAATDQKGLTKGGNRKKLGQRDMLVSRVQQIPRAASGKLGLGL